ncbi:MAG TPA: ATP-binding protein [Flavisolibacter sp.]|jgi:PAS domain S-box-containing protein
MRKKNLYPFIVSFVLLVTVIVFNRVNFRKMQDYAADVEHTREVITSLERLSNDLKSAQIYSAHYERQLGGNLYKLYSQEAHEIAKELAKLKTLVADNHEQTRRINLVAALVSKHFDTLLKNNIVEIIESGESWRLNELYSIHQTLNMAVIHEHRLLEIRKEELSESTRLANIFSTILTIIAIGIILFTFISTFLMSREQQWLEVFLESILNTSQNGIAHFKAVRKNGEITDFKVNFVNRALEPLLGIKPGDATGKKLDGLSLNLQDEKVKERYALVVETGESMQYETFYRRGETEKWFYVSLVRLGDGLTATFHDITGLKRSEEELKASISQLERSNMELEQYAYAASHDLQEPLRKIRSFGSFLLDTQASKLDQKGRDQLSKIMSAAERMSILIKDLLSLSSLKREQEFTPTDLNEILAVVLQDLDLLITQKHARVESRDLPVVKAIPLQMTQLFYNLINNSLKFSLEGVQPVISISCRKLTPAEAGQHGLSPVTNGYYELVFADNGIGFKREYRDQIFGLFKRLNDRHSFPGSGIGLALCKKVALNHGGDIWALGEEGKGAEFHIVLKA